MEDKYEKLLECIKEQFVPKNFTIESGFGLPPGLFL